MAKTFSHLHCHTSYSLLDGAAKIPELVEAARRDKQPKLCATEHGNLYGAIDLYKECKKQGDIEAIFGQEFYMVNDRLERTSLKHGNDNNNDFKARYHLTVLAENREGWENLIKLSSDAYLKGYYAKPRCDWDSLQQYSKGLIVTSGCLGGIVLQNLLHDDFKGAKAAATRLQDIFGKKNFFIELQDHGLPEQAKTNPLLIDISKQIGAPLLATNDLHYTHAGDAKAHDSLLCCQTGALISDEKRFKFQSDQHYLKTSAEMRYLFRDFEESCDNTLLVAERCDVQIDFESLHLPLYGVPEGFEGPSEYLTHLCFEGITERYGAVTDEIADRLNYELGVIDSLGMSSYMLIVWDLVQFAFKQNIRRGPARGSAAGCLVAYLLHITDIDPLKHDLMFERFINPHRIELPDIDIDFDTRYRDHMINYTKDKYGHDRCAQIITFGMIKARSAVKDAARVLGHPVAVGNALSKAMPELVSGVDTPLHACMELSPKYESGYRAAEKLRELYESDAAARETVDVALGLEGLIRQDGFHAAGLVIGDRPLNEIVPTQQKGEGEPIITQWEKKIIESLGLLKMDFLGLRNLDVITDTLELIGGGLDTVDFPLDDPKTFKMLQEGKTTGVFQLESEGLKKLIRRLRPTNIDDLAALVALYRPGPIGSNMHNDYADRKNERQEVSIFHPDAEEILAPTFSLMIYQEQLLKIASKFAGYSLPEADGLRKMVGRKLVDELAAEREKFVKGCVDEGYGEELGTKIFDMIEAFGLYGFGKGHSYGYAYISYYTAYLKANYPKEYMASLCGSVVNDIDRVAVFLHETAEMGIKVQNPDINQSSVYFAVNDEGILVGLGAVKGLSPDSAEAMVKERDKGPFTSIINFVERCEPAADVLTALAKAGAFDKFGTRLGIVSTSDNILAKYRKNKSKGLYKAEELNLFDRDSFWDLEIPKHEYAERIKLAEEKAVLGLYISGHPLNDYRDRSTGMTIQECKVTDEKYVDILVIIADVQVKRTRKGQQMAILVLEDQTGALECPVFPQMYAKTQGMFSPGDVGIVCLKVGTNNDNERNYIYQTFDRFKVTHDEDVVNGEYLNVYLPRGFAQNEKLVSRMKGLFLTHSGHTPVNLYVGKQTKVKLPYDFRINKSKELLKSIQEIFIEYRDKK